MDYAAEQEMELEALEAIFADDFREVEDNRPPDWPANAYSITVTPAVEGETEQGDDFECALLLLCYDFTYACQCSKFLTTPGSAVRLELLFAYPHTYPDEPPLYKARSVRGLSDGELEDLAAKLDEQVEANIGMAMIYAMASAAQDWLREKAAAAGVSKVELDPLAAKKAAEEAEERRLAEVRAHGTPVNPSTFAAWKARFDAEMALARARHAGDAEKRDAGLTGKAFFRQMDEAGQDLKDAEDGEYEAESEEEEDEEEEVELDEAEEEEDMLDDYLDSAKK